VNTGQLFVRNSPPAVHLIDVWINGMMADDPFTRIPPHRNDQDIFNLLLNDTEAVEKRIVDYAGAGDTALAMSLPFTKAWDKDGCTAQPAVSNLRWAFPRICPLPPKRFQLNCYCMQDGSVRPGAGDPVSFHFDCVSTTARGENPKIKRAKDLNFWYEPCEGQRFV
jgi:hypothetical protein